MNNTSELNFPKEILFCDNHLKRIPTHLGATQHDVGYFIMDALLKHPCFTNLLPPLSEYFIATNAQKIKKVVESLAPICCFLGDKTMKDIYLRAMPVKGTG